MNKLRLVFLSMFLFVMLLSTATYAAPPVTKTIQVGQLEIAPKLLDSYKIGTNVSLEFHVFNASGYALQNITPTTACDIHIYKQDGSHYIRSALVWDGKGDWEIKLTDVNTSDLGLSEVQYIVWCNNTQAGGWIDSAFWITEQGINSTIDKYPNYNMILIFGLLGFAFFMIYFSDKFKVEGDNSTKAITAILINLLFKLTGFSIVIFDIFILRNTLPSITTITSLYDSLIPFLVYGIGLLFFVLYIVNSVATLVLNLNIAKQNKEREKPYG